jgi:hypothetical protein
VDRHPRTAERARLLLLAHATSLSRVRVDVASSSGIRIRPTASGVGIEEGSTSPEPYRRPPG